MDAAVKDAEKDIIDRKEIYGGGMTYEKGKTKIDAERSERGEEGNWMLVLKDAERGIDRREEKRKGCWDDTDEKGEKE